MGGEDALGGDHAGEVVGVGLPAHEHALTAGLGGGHGVGDYVRVRITGCTPATLFGEEISEG